jgi:hypothetical protein
MSEWLPPEGCLPECQTCLEAYWVVWREDPNGELPTCVEVGCFICTEGAVQP